MSTANYTITGPLTTPAIPLFCFLECWPFTQTPVRAFGNRASNVDKYS